MICQAFLLNSMVELMLSLMVCGGRRALTAEHSPLNTCAWSVQHTQPCSLTHSSIDSGLITLITGRLSTTRESAQELTSAQSPLLVLHGG